MQKTMDDYWQDVEATVEDARAIAFDNCHKIYVLMDDEQVRVVAGYGYDPLITKDDMSSSEMLKTLRAWFQASCGLRFINAVCTVEGDPNDGFETLIPQGADEEDDDGDLWDDDYDS